jgi:hypothetical protein
MNVVVGPRPIAPTATTMLRDPEAIMAAVPRHQCRRSSTTTKTTGAILMPAARPSMTPAVTSLSLTYAQKAIARRRKITGFI